MGHATGAPNGRGVEKFATFDNYLATFRRRYKIWRELVWNANRKSYVTYQTATFPMILSDYNNTQLTLIFLNWVFLQYL